MQDVQESRRRRRCPCRSAFHRIAGQRLLPIDLFLYMSRFLELWLVQHIVRGGELLQRLVLLCVRILRMRIEQSILHEGMSLLVNDRGPEIDSDGIHAAFPLPWIAGRASFPVWPLRLWAAYSGKPERLFIPSCRCLGEPVEKRSRLSLARHVQASLQRLTEHPSALKRRLFIRQPCYSPLAHLITNH